MKQFVLSFCSLWSAFLSGFLGGAYPTSLLLIMIFVHVSWMRTTLPPNMLGNSPKPAFRIAQYWSIWNRNHNLNSSLKIPTFSILLIWGMSHFYATLCRCTVRNLGHRFPICCACKIRDSDPKLACSSFSEFKLCTRTWCLRRLDNADVDFVLTANLSNFDCHLDRDLVHLWKLIC